MSLVVLVLFGIVLFKITQEFIIRLNNPVKKLSMTV